MLINLNVHPLNFHDFSLISIIFITIHEYANLIIWISENWMKVLCLNIQLVPILKVSDELLRSALCVSMETMRFNMAQIGLFFRVIFFPI